MPDTQSLHAVHAPRPNKRRLHEPIELDDGISVRCLTTAQRNGHDHVMAQRCQIDLDKGGGTVGCPGCPYNRRAT